MKINKKTLSIVAIVLIAGAFWYQKAQAQDSVNVGVAFTTDYIVRGETVSTDAIQGSFGGDVEVDVPLVDLDVYVQGLLTRDGDTGPDATDVSIGGTTTLNETLTLDVGARYLDTTRLSREVYAGLKLEGTLSPSIYVYRSLNQDFTTAEAAVELAYELGLWGLDLDTCVKAQVGYADGPVETGYYGLCYKVSKDISENGKIFAGVLAVASTAEEYEDTVSFTAGYTHTF